MLPFTDWLINLDFTGKWLRLADWMAHKNWHISKAVSWFSKHNESVSGQASNHHLRFCKQCLVIHWPCLSSCVWEYSESDGHQQKWGWYYGEITLQVLTSFYTPTVVFMPLHHYFPVVIVNKIDNLMFPTLYDGYWVSFYINWQYLRGVDAVTSFAPSSCLWHHSRLIHSTSRGILT